MKVLICIPCLLTGGTEIQTLNLVLGIVLTVSMRMGAYYSMTTPIV